MKPKFFLAAGVVLMLAFVLVLGTAAAQPANPCDPAFVGRTGKIIRVSPTEVDDTANIQCAFDWANARGPGMTVRLTPGTFHTAQIVVNDFNGSFRGSGADKTLIVNLPNLYVTPLDGFINPPSADNPLPFLFSFIDGRFVIADMAVHVDGHEGNVTTGWSVSGPSGFTTYELIAAFLISGTQADAWVTRILIEGEPLENTLFGYSAINGIYYEGIIGAIPLPLSGSYRLSRSTIKTVGSGSPIANLKDASVSISHNTYEDAFVMMDAADFVDSTIEIASNKAETFIGIDFWQYMLSEDVGTKFVVRNNRFAGTYGVIFEQTIGAGTTCLIKSNDFRQILDTSVLLIGAGTDQCVVKNNRE